ncbi:MAG: methyltransferase domain-containing protein [Chloroflexota bacterium]|nr:methyltransferase domain-containing protein [Chloroflexota bacterium]
MRWGDPRDWDYGDRVRARLARARRALDLGTGDGEIFASFAPFAGVAVATETWPANVPIAGRRLRGVGAHLIHCTPAPDNVAVVPARTLPSLPFRDAAFDLVIDRHESFVATEVARVLGGGGWFVTQQVGGRNLLELNDALGAPLPYFGWHLVSCCRQLEDAGLRVLDRRESFTDVQFDSIDQVMEYLDAVPWQAPGVARPRSARALERLSRRLPLRARAHRFYVEATKRT